MLLVITDTVMDCSMQVFPYSSAEGPAEGTVADENDVFCRGDGGDGLVDGSVGDFTGIGSPDEEAICIFVQGGETFGRV